MTRFEQFANFVGFEVFDGVLIEVLEPCFVEIGLGGEEDKSFVIEFKGTGGALFGLGVVLFDPIKRVVTIDL